jgi:hypothetical protein
MFPVSSQSCPCATGDHAGKDGSRASAQRVLDQLAAIAPGQCILLRELSRIETLALTQPAMSVTRVVRGNVDLFAGGLAGHRGHHPRAHIQEKRSFPLAVCSVLSRGQCIEVDCLRCKWRVLSLRSYLQKLDNGGSMHTDLTAAAMRQKQVARTQSQGEVKCFGCGAHFPFTNMLTPVTKISDAAHLPSASGVICRRRYFRSTASSSVCRAWTS